MAELRRPLAGCPSRWIMSNKFCWLNWAINPRAVPVCRWPGRWLVVGESWGFVCWGLNTEMVTKTGMFFGKGSFHRIERKRDVLLKRMIFSGPQEMAQMGNSWLLDVDVFCVTPNSPIKQFESTISMFIIMLRYQKKRNVNMGPISLKLHLWSVWNLVLSFNLRESFPNNSIPWYYRVVKGGGSKGRGFPNLP